MAPGHRRYGRRPPDDGDAVCGRSARPRRFSAGRRRLQATNECLHQDGDTTPRCDSLSRSVERRTDCSVAPGTESPVRSSGVRRVSNDGNAADSDGIPPIRTATVTYQGGSTREWISLSHLFVSDKRLWYRSSPAATPETNYSYMCVILSRRSRLTRIYRDGETSRLHWFPRLPIDRVRGVRYSRGSASRFERLIGLSGVAD